MVSLVAAPDPTALPDTLAIYVTATARPPRYAPPQGGVAVRDSVFVAVAMAPSPEPAPVTEVQLTLPVTAVSRGRFTSAVAGLAQSVRTSARGLSRCRGLQSAVSTPKITSPGPHRR